MGIPTGRTQNPRNPVTVTGDSDPSWTGQELTHWPWCGPTAERLAILNVPPDVVYASAAEILCGQRGVDWRDVNGDGRPDTCWDDANGNGRFDAGEAPTGIFDGQHAISIRRLDTATDT